MTKKPITNPVSYGDSLKLLETGEWMEMHDDVPLNIDQPESLTTVATPEAPLKVRVSKDNSSKFESVEAAGVRTMAPNEMRQSSQSVWTGVVAPAKTPVATRPLCVSPRNTEEMDKKTEIEEEYDKRKDDAMSTIPGTPIVIPFQTKYTAQVKSSSDLEDKKIREELRNYVNAKGLDKDEIAARKRAEEVILKCYSNRDDTLDLQDLGLTSLPSAIDKLPWLKRLSINQNPNLTKFPTSITSLKELEVIDVDATDPIALDKWNFSKTLRRFFGPRATVYIPVTPVNFESTSNWRYDCDDNLTVVENGSKDESKPIIASGQAPNEATTKLWTEIKPKKESHIRISNAEKDRGR